MGVVAWVGVGVALWLAVALPLSLLVGRAIRRRDEQVPGSHRSSPSNCSDPDRDVAARPPE